MPTYTFNRNGHVNSITATVLFGNGLSIMSNNMFKPQGHHNIPFPFMVMLQYVIPLQYKDGCVIRASTQQVESDMSKALSFKR